MPARRLQWREQLAVSVCEVIVFRSRASLLYGHGAVMIDTPRIDQRQ